MPLYKLIPLPAVDAGNNDRTVFDAAYIRELADSIATNGLIQPITVRAAAERYQLIAGECRTRACRLLKWDTIPAFVVDADDKEASAMMLAENLARRDLNPIDEGAAYQSRVESGWTVEELSKRVGVTAVRVHFRLKLLKLRPELQKLIRDGHFQIGYAQILADAELDKNRQLIAMRHLLTNQSPNPAWFRKVVNELSTQQAQTSMFDDTLFAQDLIADDEDAPPTEPPHPSTDTPPTLTGATPHATITAHIAYWQAAADQWDAAGKVFKKQECLAAVAALQAVTTHLPTESPINYSVTTEREKDTDHAKNNNFLGLSLMESRARMFQSFRGLPPLLR